MKVAIYARVSTDDKDQNTERQILKCQHYCEIHEHEVAGVWEEHITGDSNPFDRPECGRALRFGVDGVVIWSMDRLSRQHPLKVLRLIEDLKNQGIKVISVSEPAFNMEHELSEVLLFLIGWFNNYFLKKLRKDIKSGLDRAVAQGKTLGAPRAKFNKFRAVELFRQGVPLRVMSSELGVSIATLSRFRKVYLKNPDSFIKD